MRPDFILEVSWEVCNKSTELHNVLASKAKAINLKNYVLIGPYLNHVEDKDFLEKPLPTSLIPAFDELRKLGIVCYFGSYHNAKAILIDFSRLFNRREQIKEDLWEWFKI